jgi:hypothetical protein
VAVFIDAKRLSEWGRGDIIAAYEALLARFRLLGHCGLGERVSAVSACDASSRHAAEAAGVDFARVGDACLSLDPLSSQGIQTAVASALQAAVVANTILRHPANAPAAIAFYASAQRERRMRYAAKTARIYGECAVATGAPFWRARAVHAGEARAFAPAARRLDPEVGLSLSPLAAVAPAPAIAGDLVTMQDALSHPSLDRPAAFLGDVALAPLIAQITAGANAAAIVAAWSARLSTDRCWRLMEWFWERRIVVPAGSHG